MISPYSLSNPENELNASLSGQPVATIGNPESSETFSAYGKEAAIVSTSVEGPKFELFTSPLKGIPDAASISFRISIVSSGVDVSGRYILITINIL